MKRNVSINPSREERPKLSRREHHEVVPRPKTGEDIQRRRREWLIQQEREREHERLKRKMIMEYEIRRAREQGLPFPKRRLSHRSRSKSRSRSPESQHRSAAATVTKPPVMSEKVELSSGSTPLFKGPEGTQISETELRRIKVDIHRNILIKAEGGELQRDIVNPEDVVLKRRDGEGSKPIFERDEIKSGVNKPEEIEERRTVVALDNGRSGALPQSSKRQSVSPSPSRKRGQSPRRASSRHSRYDDTKYKDDRADCHSSQKEYREQKHSRDRSREYRERYKDKDVKRHSSSHPVDEDYSHKRRDRRDHSRSRERDRDTHRRSAKDERSYRERSRERSRERRDRERSRERRIPPSHYIEQVPVPIYYGNFPPRPIVVGPMVPLRGQVPMGRTRHPAMMGPVRPFPSRFFPPDVYRLGPPPNPRFGPLF